MAWWVCLTFFQTRRYRFWATRLSLSELDLPSDLMPVLVFFGWVDLVVLVVGPSVWPKLLQESSSGLVGLG